MKGGKALGLEVRVWEMGVGAWDENQEHLAQLDGGTTRLGARLARALREEKGTGGGWRDPVTSAMRSSLSPLQRGRKPRNNSHDPGVAVLLCCQMVTIWCGVEERADEEIAGAWARSSRWVRLFPCDSLGGSGDGGGGRGSTIS